MNRIKKWSKKAWYIWIIICILELFFIMYFKFDRIRNITLKVFLDTNGNFNWTIITAITAISAIVFGWINNNKNIKANLVSKSRIEWIQEVRKISVEFLDPCHNVISLISIIKSSGSEPVAPQNDKIVASASLTLTVEKGKHSDI